MAALMRQFISSHLPDDSATRIAYRVSRPGRDPSLHGVWWPRSNDLGAELPSVVQTLSRRGFVTEWVSFSQRAWPGAGRQLFIAGRVIRTSSYRAIDPNMVSLSGRDGRARIDLLVVPPGSSSAVASRAFSRVLDWDDRSTDGAALATSTSAGAADDTAMIGLRPVQGVPA